MSDEQDRVLKISDEVELYVKDPNYRAKEQADLKKAVVFKQAIESGVPTRERMMIILKTNGVWDDDKETEAQEKQKELETLVDALEEGGIAIETAREYAIKCGNLRAEIIQDAAAKIEYLSNCAEAKSNNAEFDYLVSACVVYNSDRNRPYFKNYEDYLNKKDTPEGYAAAQICSKVFYGLNTDDTPEANFLREFNFVDDKMRFINEEGELIDADGRLVDEEGRYIKHIGKGENKRTVFVDVDGKQIKERRRKPFLDTEGKPIKKK